jgi:hypothetical protein
MSGSSSDRLAQRLEQLAGTVDQLAKRSEETETRQKISAYGSQLRSHLAAAEAAIKAAETDLAAAHDNGEGQAVAAAQRKLAEAISNRDSTTRKLEEHKAAVAEYDRRQSEAVSASSAQTTKTADDTTQKEPDRTNLDAWTAKNDWYGVDPDLTQAANEIDSAIRKAGVISVGSKAYFDAVDKQMAARYPDRFRGAAQGAGGGSHGGGGGSSSRAASAAGRIPADVIDSWKRMGINTDDPEVMTRMVKNREALVEKGILPEQPQYGRVRA